MSHLYYQLLWELLALRQDQHSVDVSPKFLLGIDVVDHTPIMNDSSDSSHARQNIALSGAEVRYPVLGEEGGGAAHGEKWIVAEGGLAYVSVGKDTLDTGLLCWCSLRFLGHRCTPSPKGQVEVAAEAAAAWAVAAYCGSLSAVAAHSGMARGDVALFPLSICGCGSPSDRHLKCVVCGERWGMSNPTLSKTHGKRSELTWCKYGLYRLLSSLSTSKSALSALEKKIYQKNKLSSKFEKTPRNGGKW